MTKSKIVLYSFILLLLLFVTGCFGSDEHASEIKGKFIFDSNRFELSDVFITENGRTKLLFKKAYNPAWSHDGKKIACLNADKDFKKKGFWILNSRGDKKEFVEVGYPISYLVWSSDGSKIFYSLYEHFPTTRNNKVYGYDVLSKSQKKILELGEKFRIGNIAISPKGDKLLISGSGPKNDLGVYLSNSNGTNLRKIGCYAGHRGAWFPDNEHIGYITNVTEDRQMYSKEGWGYFFKMNVNTGDVEKLWLSKTPFLLNLKISRDGKHFYYTAPAPGGGRAVFVSPIDNPGKKIQITYPVFLTPASHGRSQDWNPDWYQR